MSSEEHLHVSAISIGICIIRSMVNFSSCFWNDMEYGDTFESEIRIYYSSVGVAVNGGNQFFLILSNRK